MLHILYYTAILNDPKRIFRETPEFIVRIVLLPQLDVVLHFFQTQLCDFNLGRRIVMGEENLKDVVGAKSGEVLVDKTSVGRTFAYAVSVLAQMLWIVITTLLLITDDEGHESERAWWDSGPNEHSFDFWENMSHDTGKLLPCLLLPLLIIVPPIFSRRKHRALSTLVLCGLGLLLGGLHLLSTLVWLVQAEQDALKRRAPELLLRELTSVVLALLLAFVLHSTYRTWNQGKLANAAVDVNQVRFLLGLVTSHH